MEEFGFLLIFLIVTLYQHSFCCKTVSFNSIGALDLQELPYFAFPLLLHRAKNSDPVTQHLPHLPAGTMHSGFQEVYEVANRIGQPRMHKSSR